MSGIVRVMGVDLPILIDSLSLNGEEVGNRARDVGGWLVAERRAIKNVIAGVLSPKPLNEAMMYRALLRGDGEYWSMRFGAYGAKGWGITGTGAWNGATANTNPNYNTGAWIMTAGQTMAVEGNLYNQSVVATSYSGRTGSTLVGWRKNLTTGNFSLVGFSWRARDVTATVKREIAATTGPGSGGLPQAFTGPETFAVTSGSGPASTSLLTITNPAAQPSLAYSGLHLLPWYLPQTQLDMLLTGRNTVMYSPPDLPFVAVETDLFPMDQIEAAPTSKYLTTVMLGDVDSMQIQPVMNGGQFDQTFTGLSFTLTEI